MAITRSLIDADDARRDRRRSGLDRKTWDYKYGAAIRTLVLINIQAKLRQTGDLPHDVDRGTGRMLVRLGPSCRKAATSTSATTMASARRRR